MKEIILGLIKEHVKMLKAENPDAKNMLSAFISKQEIDGEQRFLVIQVAVGKSLQDIRSATFIEDTLEEANKMRDTLSRANMTNPEEKREALRKEIEEMKRKSN